MARPRRIRIRLLATASIATLALAACGGSGSDSSDSSGSKTPDTNAVLRFGESTGAAPTLDPHKNATEGLADWYSAAYESLLKLTPDNQLEPRLATKWTFSPDNTTLTLTLRSGVTFSDGTPFDGAAVKANIERGQTVAGSAVRASLAPITAVTVNSPTEVVFTLSGASGPLLTNLALEAGAMISPTAFRAGTIDTKPAGTGPYVLEDYKPGQEATYVRNPNYWGTKPAIAKIIITLYTDATAGTNALISGQLDMYKILDKQTATLVKNGGKVVAENASLNLEMVSLNTGTVFKDERVRQALAYATDKEALAAFAGRGSAAYQWVKPDNPLYDKSLGSVYKYDVDKAKKLLAEAGFPNGLSFTIWHTDAAYTKQAVQILIEQWAKAGFKVTDRTSDAATLVSQCYTARVCDAVEGPRTSLPDFAQEANDGLILNGRRNLSPAAVPGFDSLLTAALATSPDRQSKVAALQSAYSKAVPLIPLRYDPVVYGTSPKVYDVSAVRSAPVWLDLKMTA